MATSAGLIIVMAMVSFTPRPPRLSLFRGTVLSSHDPPFGFLEEFRGIPSIDSTVCPNQPLLRVPSAVQTVTPCSSASGRRSCPESSLNLPRASSRSTVRASEVRQKTGYTNIGKGCNAASSRFAISSA